MSQEPGTKNQDGLKSLMNFFKMMVHPKGSKNKESLLTFSSLGS